MDIEQTLSALELVSEALDAAVSSGSEQVSEPLARRDRLIALIPSHDREGVVQRLQQILETGELVRKHLIQNRSADLSTLDRLRQVSSTLAAPQSNPTLDCIG